MHDNAGVMRPKAGKLCLYDAASQASAIIDAIANTNTITADPPRSGYGGRVRIQIKGDGAETLLARLVERIQRLNEHHGWTATGPPRLPDTKNPAHRTGSTDNEPHDLRLTNPPPVPPKKPEVYVSYAWKQEQADPLLDDLIKELRDHGIEVRRDSSELQPGDRISEFMNQLSAGRCVLLVISANYLRSPNCMTELYGIWTHARQHEDEFLRRVVPLVQDDAGISSIEGRIDHAVYWKRQYKKLDALIRKHGADVIGEADFKRYKRIGDFYRDVGDLLSYVDDVLIPRDRPSLSGDGFAVVGKLIKKALV
jgi:internalin A